MNFSLFIGNLNYDTTNNQLLTLLSQYGQILKCEITIDRFTLKSKGFAFTEVEDRATADKIISSLNGRELDGRVLKIEYLKDL